MVERIIEWSVRHQWVVFGVVFAMALWAADSIRKTPLDAVPDLSDPQVIIYTEWMGRSPDLVEDQITYPLVRALQSTPGVRTVRGYSMFGMSFTYALFGEGTDIYWARTRVLEQLGRVQQLLPPGVSPTLGPDASGVGWIYQYVLKDTTGRMDVADLRTLQDFTIRPALQAVAGVAEVASVGGFQRQYQIVVDPDRLVGFGLTLTDIARSVRDANAEVGARVLELAGREYVLRGRGYVKELADLEQSVVAVGAGGTPVRLGDVASVRFGPEIRRGAADFNGVGEAVGGIVVMRIGSNALQVIEAVKQQVATLRLPEGVQLIPTYDRSDLIVGSIATLRDTLIQQAVIVTIICLVFLFHARSALVVMFVLPLSVLFSFIAIRYLGLTSNIMSLGGIAISIGVLIDAAVIMVENAHKHYEEWRGQRSQMEIIKRSAQEVGPTLFFTLLVITVSFLPIFTLEAQEGRLFKPLAFTKTYSMAIASVLAVTVIPVLMYWFVRGRIFSEERHPVSRFLRFVYTPVLNAALRWRWPLLVVVVLVVLATLVPLRQIGSEFMPPLWEGDLLYMPTTFPGISITKAREIVQQTDRIIRSFPEVESVFGKVGHAETATDPAPLSMFETTIVLKDPSQWRPGLTKDDLIAELDAAIQFPGLTNAWTMPIKTRLDMLSTGFKTPVGVKVAGPDLAVLEELAGRIEAVVKPLPGTLSAYAERVMGGTYLDFDIDRQAASRFGLTVGDVQDVIQSAVGGVNVSWTVEGLQRYPINVRYPRELRDDPVALREILVATPTGGQVPLGQLATIELRQGPPEIKSENARPNAWVYVDLRGIDVGTWVRRAQREVAERVDVPTGYTVLWSGQYEYMQRARARLLLIVPLTLALIFLILYFHQRSLVKTAIVLSAIPFSLVGSVWMLWALGYDWSIAVWVGMIALAGLDAETGVVMLLYLDMSYERWGRKGRMETRAHLVEAVDHGAVQRIRPKMMTVLTILFSLVPILWSTGTGADVMRRIAAPMVGGVVTSFLGELLVFPAIYFIWRGRKLARAPSSAPAAPTATAS